MSVESDVHINLRDHSHRSQSHSSTLTHLANRIGNPEQAASRWQAEFNKIPFVPPGVRAAGNVGLEGFKIGAKLGKFMYKETH